MNQEVPFLNETGIVITRTHLTVPGRTFAWRSLEFVRVFGPGTVQTQLGPEQPHKYHIMVSTKTEPVLVSVFETEDEALMRRVEQAISRAGEVLRAQRP